MTYAVLSCTHRGAPAVGHGASRKLVDQSDEITGEVIDEIIQDGLQGTLFLGDAIEHDGTNANRDEANYLGARKILDRIPGPKYDVIGNHDLLNLSLKAVNRMIGHSGEYGVDDLGDQLLVRLFSYSPNRDGSAIRVSDEQIAWLKNVLKLANKPIIAMLHHPLGDVDLSNNHWFKDHAHCALVENSDEIRTLLAKSNKVIAVLNGHLHHSNMTVHDNIPYVSIGSPIEALGPNYTPAKTYGLMNLKEASFGLEIFGRESSLLSHDDIVRHTQSTYNSIAKVYRANTAQYGKAEHDEFDKIMARIKMQSTEHSWRMADYGAGSSLYRDAPHYLANGMNRYIAIDPSNKFYDGEVIDHGKTLVLPIDMFDAKLPDNSVTIAWHSAMYQHIKPEKLDELIQKTADALEPGGFLFSHYRAGTGESWQISTEYGVPIIRYIALYEEKDIKRAMEKAGLIVRDEDSWTFDHKYSGLKGQTVKYKAKTIGMKPY